MSAESTIITEKSKKNDILDAYQQALKEIKALKQLSKKQQQALTDQQAMVSEASASTPDGLVNHLATLKLTITQALDKLGEELLAEQSRLVTLQSAIKVEEAALKTKHDIVAEADSLDALILAHQTRRQEFEKEIAEKQSAFETQYNEQRQAWQQESSQMAAKIKEEAATLKKTRQREEEEHQYDLAQARKKEQDAYQAKQTALEKSLQDKREAFEKDFSAREQAIVAQETEFNELKEQAATFPTTLQARVEQEVAATKAQLERQFKYERELTAKEMTGKVALYEQTNASLQEKIAEQQRTIAQLLEKEAHANTQAQKIAVKAIESSAYQGNTLLQRSERDKQSTGEMTTA